MQDDVELLRDIMLALEDQQRSPRMTVVLSVADQAEALDSDPGDVGAALDRLLSLDYIDGPGAEAGGLWLFRKLTRKGNRFVQEARDPADWAHLKQRYRR